MPDLKQKSMRLTCDWAVMFKDSRMFMSVKAVPDDVGPTGACVS